MPKVFIGKKKNGQPKEFGYPAWLVDSKDKVVWQEWPVGNGYRDKHIPVLFDKSGKPLRSTNPGLIFGRDGRPANGTAMGELVSREELKLLFAKPHASMEKLRWMDKKVKTASLTLQQVLGMKEGQEKIAAKLITGDPLFREGLMFGKIKFPKDKPVTIKMMQEVIGNYFVEALTPEIIKRKKAYLAAEEHTTRNARRIIAP